MKKQEKVEFELKDSYFDGYEYRGYKVRTKLVIEGQSEYRPLRLSCSGDVYNLFKDLHESDREKYPTLDRFLPRVVPRLEEIRRSLE